MELCIDDSEKTKRFKPLGRLGEGAFGEVRLGIDTHTGANVAMKYVAVAAKSRGISKAVFREIQSLRQLRGGSHVVELLDYFPDETNICLVFEYLPSDLQAVISQATNYFSIGLIKAFSLMLLQGVSFCHSRNIIHRDIKPSNILISSSGQIKLGDFGLARVFDPTCVGSMSHQVATRMYRAPELLFASRRYDCSTDIWSAGAVIAELILLTPIFPGSNDIDQIFKVFQVVGSPNPENWPDAALLPDYSKVTFPIMEPMNFRVLMPMASDDTIAFVLTMLALDPKRRWTAVQCIQSSYFSTMPLPSPLTACAVVLHRNKKPQPETSGSCAAISSVIDAAIKFPV